MTRIQTLNDKGQVITERYYDENGKPSTRSGSEYEDTYCMVEFTYDKMGNVNREKYYDENGDLILCRKGYAIVYREYDAYNRVLYEKFSGNGVEDPQLEDGAFSYRYEYNADGELTTIRKYDWLDHEIQ